MKSKLKVIFLTAFMILAVMLVTSCQSSDVPPYQDYNTAGHTVSVKYDANGGFFTTNTTVIVDTYNPDKLKTDSNGNKTLSLISPDNEARGSANAFTARYDGCFLAGWYTERTPVLDSEGNHLDVYGGIAAKSGKPAAYTYSGKWNFDTDKFTLDKNATYNAETPVVTLYAAWIPNFTYEFYTADGRLLSTYSFNPANESEIDLPFWNEATGKIDMQDFPRYSSDVSGDVKTFKNAYLDQEMTELITTKTIAHHGYVDYATASATNPVMKLYVDYMDGDWYKVYNTSQFISNATPFGSYEILADLDFTDAIWPTSLVNGNFSGSIIGNGHTFSNITVVHTDTSRSYAGLFGQITEYASISNISFTNVSFTIKSGTRTNMARYGLLTGSLSAGATIENLSISDSTLYIHPSAGMAMPSDVSIGLLCGYGSTRNSDISGIKCEAVIDETAIYEVQIETNGNDVSVTFSIPEETD